MNGKQAISVCQNVLCQNKVRQAQKHKWALLPVTRYCLERTWIANLISLK
jgi:hypothetical protein